MRYDDIRSIIHFGFPSIILFIVSKFHRAMNSRLRSLNKKNCVDLYDSQKL